MRSLLPIGGIKPIRNDAPTSLTQFAIRNEARSPLASPLLYETLREGRRLANAIRNYVL